jgi:hypothetical protein
MTATVEKDLHASMLEARLKRQNRLIDVLETEIDRAKTEAETEVILEVLSRARKRLDALEIEAYCVRAGIPAGGEPPFFQAPQPELHGWFVRDLNA